VEKLAEAAGKNRHGLRDATMIRMPFMHGLQAVELVGLEWTQVDLDAGNLSVRRKKIGSPAVHLIHSDIIRALRKLQRQAPGSRWVFLTGPKDELRPCTEAGFAKMVKRAAVEVGLAELRVHPHMLRHACGRALVNAGRDTRSLQAFMGHRDIRHTELYTSMSETRFRHFWDGVKGVK
jgi:site-specific recombinase XerD